MEPYCALKTAGYLFKNKSCYHHNANDRFGFNDFIILLILFFQNISCQPLAFFILLSIISHVTLYNISYRPQFYPYSCSHAAPMFLLSLSAICPALVRYMSAFTPNIYRTYTGHIPDMYRRCYLAVCLFHWRSLLGIIEVFTRYYRDMLVFFPCCMWDCILFGLQRYEFYLNQDSSSRGICLMEIVFLFFLVKYQ